MKWLHSVQMTGSPWASMSNVQGRAEGHGASTCLGSSCLSWTWVMMTPCGKVHLSEMVATAFPAYVLLGDLDTTPSERRGLCPLSLNLMDLWLAQGHWNAAEVTLRTSNAGPQTHGAASARELKHAA